MVSLKSLTSKTVSLSTPVLYTGAASGIGVILLVGLLSGLVGRPNNCIKPEDVMTTTFTPLTSTTTTPRPVTTTTTTTTTTPSTTTRPSTTSTTTSTTTRPASTTTSTTRPTTTSTSTTTTTRPTTTTTSTTTTTRPTTTTTSTTTTSTTRPTTTTTTTTTTSTTRSTSTSTTTPTTTTTTTRSTTTTTPSTTTRTSTTTTSTTTTTTRSTSTTTTTPTTTSTTTKLSTATLTLPSTSTPATTQTTTPILVEDVRLPNITTPTNYELLIKAFFEPISASPDPTKEYFHGSVKIDIVISEETPSIILHADRSLMVNNTKLQKQDGSPVVIKNEARLPFQRYGIETSEKLAPGQYVLSMDFYGNYGPISNLVGFYRSRYLEDGVYKTVLATNFEPIDARKAFPCFDEPAYKATYVITVEHPKDTLCLSNWPEESNSTVGDRTTTKFLKTKAMPTYLPAWVLAPKDYGYVEDTLSDGKLVRVYGRKSAIENNLVEFALEVAVKITEFFRNEYFGIEEGLPPKIDLVALPDFPAGAMENWGVILFRETALYYNENVNSLERKQSVAGIIAHELAHFWFGNLVTCAWWNDLWLNEAMATFLQYKSMQKVYPELDLQDQFIGTTLVPVMYDDGYSSSHPVSVEVTNPDNIGSLFSSITYDKGCSVLRMLESTVGDTNFQNGLKNYLTNLAFGNGVASEFYATLEVPKEMKDENVSAQEYIETWLLQINYPEVDIRINNNGSATVVDFVQNRFLLTVYDESFIDNVQSPYNYTWKIYLQCKAGMVNSPDIYEFNFYLGKERGQTTLNKKYDWVKCNRDFNGFYVNNYDPADYEKIIDTLRSHPESFSIGDRANLIHVAYTLAFRGSLSYNTAAYLSSYLADHETDYVPWRVFFWHMNKLSQILEHRPVFNTLRKYGLSLAKSLAENIDLWNDYGNHTERLLKINMIEFLCRMQDASCLRNATSLYETVPVEYFTSPVENAQNNTIAPNFRQPVYRFHIQNTYDYLDWFNLNELYLSTIDPSERATVVSALSYSRLLWIVDIYLSELLEDKSRIRPQDFFDVISFVGRNPSGRHVAWAFIRQNWNVIVSKFGNSRALNRAIKNICESFDNVFLLEEVLMFFDTTPAGSGAMFRFQTIEIIANNIFWVADHEKDLENAFFTPNKNLNY